MAVYFHEYIGRKKVGRKLGRIKFAEKREKSGGSVFAHAYFYKSHRRKIERRKSTSDADWRSDSEPGERSPHIGRSYTPAPVDHAPPLAAVIVSLRGNIPRRSLRRPSTSAFSISGVLRPRRSAGVTLSFIVIVSEMRRWWDGQRTRTAPDDDGQRTMAGSGRWRAADDDGLAEQ